MKRLNHLLTTLIITAVVLIGLFWNLNSKTEAAQWQPLFLYDAKPDPHDAKPVPYEHTVQEPYYYCPWCPIHNVPNTYKGQTFLDNFNHWGYEIYVCDSKGGTIKRQPRNVPLDFYAKRDKDICIPQATIDEQDRKRWPKGICPNISGLECFEIQHLIDGPHQTEDTRTLNGTGLPNSQINICTRELGRPGDNPYLNITEDFVYKPFMCQEQESNEIMLAGREDPYAEECLALVGKEAEVFASPFDYSESELSCFLYFGDMAKVWVCKKGEEERGRGECAFRQLSNSINGIHPAPQPSENLCDLFDNGEGVYEVTIQLFDSGSVVYGNGDLWLTYVGHLPTPTPIPTGSIAGYVWEDTNDVCPADGTNKYADRTDAVRLNPGDVYSDTDGNGYYEFTSLTFGAYDVTVIKGDWSCACAGGNPGVCVKSVTLDIFTPDVTVDLSIVDIKPAWFQVIDGDIHSNRDIDNPVPGT